jgi:hypothetical protein
VAVCAEDDNDGLRLVQNGINAIGVIYGPLLVPLMSLPCPVNMAKVRNHGAIIDKPSWIEVFPTRAIVFPMVIDLLEVSITEGAGHAARATPIIDAMGSPLRICRASTRHGGPLSGTLAAKYRNDSVFPLRWRSEIVVEGCVAQWFLLTS